MDTIKVKLKPSRIGSYYEQLCGRYLIYDGVGSEQARELGWTIDVQSDSTHARAGEKWEQTILEQLKAENTVDVLVNESDSRKKYTFEQTVDIFKNLKKNCKRTYIYQACINVTDSFKNDYMVNFNNQNYEIYFGSMYPDFLQIDYSVADDKFVISVIDVKNADHMKINAQIQITLYAEIIKRIIKDYNLTNFEVDDKGIVWNKEVIKQTRLENIFDMKDAKKEIELFFQSRLNDACASFDKDDDGDAIFEKLPCRFSNKCGVCQSYNKCLELLKARRSARLLPYLSEEAQERLDQLIISKEIPDDTIDSVIKMLNSKDGYKLTDGCNYWKNVSNHYQAYYDAMDAMFKGQMGKFPKGTSTISFPEWNDFGLFMTAQRDPDSGRVYAYAFSLFIRKNVSLFNLPLNAQGYLDNKSNKELEDVFLANDNTEAEFDRIDKEFVEAIYNILYEIDNCGEPDENKRLQFFVMDSYERYNVENQLFYMLENLDPVKDQALLEKVMTIIFWLQGERVVTDAQAQPEEEVDNPVSDIVSALNQLYVITSPARYNLIDVSKIFSPNYNFYDPTNSDGNNGFIYYFENMSDVLNGMTIYNIWNTKPDEVEKDGKLKKDAQIERLTKHLRMRMDIERVIVKGIEADKRNKLIHISVKATPYKMLKNKYPNDPEIASLYFENHLEELLKYHQIRNTRVRGIDNAIEEGNILSVKYIGGNRYSVLNYDNYIGKEWFNTWICEDTPYNREQIMLLDEKAFWKRAGSKAHSFNYMTTYDSNIKQYVETFYFAKMGNKLDFVDSGNGATLYFESKSDDFDPVAGAKYLLFEVYHDYNSPKTDGGLDILLTKNNWLDPLMNADDTGIILDSVAEAECKKYWSPDGFSFSNSQYIAFDHLFRRKQTVLVGPPAAGKTDFISRSIITLSSYYKNVRNENLKILVSANSHSAIENILLKLIKMKQAAARNNVNIADIKLFKVDKIDDSSELLHDEKNVQLIKYQGEFSKIGSAVAAYSNDIVVVGATGWSLSKEGINAGGGLFDLVIIDEASQVRNMDAFLHVESSKADARIMLVGDDDQLPPIIGGNYKIVPNEKYIHGSVFKMYLTALQKEYDRKYPTSSHDFINNKDIDIITLEDNFRMNNILCRYSAEKIYANYGMDYKANIQSIARQLIQLGSKTGDELIDFMLDPEYPLVFCKLKGNSIKQKEAEIEITTDLVKALLYSIKNPNGILAKDMENFWDEVVKNGITYDGACGIISPHHEHINKVKTSIKDAFVNENEINKKVFIGTVDKLQGKERTSVIVTYGVNDKETVQNEAEFIFSRNRFNVSLTRGKAKTIVLLSDVIAESSLFTNILKAQSDEISKGIEFVQGFEEFMATAKADEDVVKKDFSYLGGDVNLVVYKKRIK